MARRPASTPHSALHSARLSRLSKKDAPIKLKLISLAVSGVLMTLSSAHAQQAAQMLPSTQMLVGGNWIGAKMPTVAQTNNGLVMTIKQLQKHAVLDWSRFDINKGEEVHFDQQSADWIALNRIFSADPTKIAGKITAKGQVWLQNTNGIIFQSGAQVNVHSILATAHKLNDELLVSRGFNSVEQLLKGGTKVGDIRIESGASIHAESSDPNIRSRILLTGANVINDGRISVKDGEVAAVAGEYVNIGFPTLRFGEAPETARKLDLYSGIYLADGSAERVLGGANGVGKQPFVRNGDNFEEFDRELHNRAVTLGLQIINNGEISAERGDINWTGRELIQNGLISATSGVGQRNGSIRLNADYGPVYIYNDVDLGVLLPVLVSSTRFTKNSITQLMPDKSPDTGSILEGNRQRALSNISIQFDNNPGILVDTQGDITLDENALIRSPSGRVQLIAQNAVRQYPRFFLSEFFSADRLLEETEIAKVKLGAIGNRGAVILRKGAKIDVSGLRNVEFDASSDVLDVDVRANELASSPRQRDGLLPGQNVAVDKRYGTRLLDWTGNVLTAQETAQQRAIRGGQVLLSADDMVVVDKDAAIDISGGSKSVAGGFVKTTMLRRADGRVINIANASPDDLYNNVTTQARWREGYSEGGDAGELVMYTAQARLSGKLVSNNYNSNAQLEAGINGIAPKAPVGANLAGENLPTVRLAKGGSFKTLEKDDLELANSPRSMFIVPDESVFTTTIGEQTLSLDSIALLPSDDQLRTPRLYDAGLTPAYYFIDDGFLSQLQSVKLEWNKYSSGKDVFLDILDSSKISLAEGGSLKQGNPRVRSIGRNVEISAPSGTIELIPTPFEYMSIADGVRLSTAGVWVNDLGGVSQTSTAYLNGGNITLGDAVLLGAVNLDVSGGGWYRQTATELAGKNTYSLLGGRAGGLSLKVGPQAPNVYWDRLNLRTDGLNGAGRLKLSGANIVISAEGGQIARNDEENTLYLSDQKINELGLSELLLGQQREDVLGRLTALNDTLIGTKLDVNVFDPYKVQVTITAFGRPTADKILLLQKGEVLTAENIQKLRDAKVEFVPLLATGINLESGTRLNLRTQNLAFTNNKIKLASGGDLYSVTKVVQSSGVDESATRLGISSLAPLNVANDVSIQVAPRGSVSLSAPSVKVNGQIIAPGGRISLAATELLEVGGRLDASGIARSYVKDNGNGELSREGYVLAGGTIDLNAGGGTLNLLTDAELNVSGVNGQLTRSDFTSQGVARVNKIVGSDAGNISLNGTSGSLGGNLIANAGLAGRRAGSLIIQGAVTNNLTRINDAIGEATNYGELFGTATTLAELIDANPSLFPSISAADVEPLPLSEIAAIYQAALQSRPELITSSVRVTKEAGSSVLNTAPPSGFIVPDTYTLQTDQNKFDTAINAISRFAKLEGNQLTVSEQVRNSFVGMDRLSLSAARIDLIGDINIAARNSVSLTSGLVFGTGNSTLSAPYVNLLEANTLPSGNPSSGIGSLTIDANVIQVVKGDSPEGQRFLIDGFSTATLNARNELRGGDINGNTATLRATGALNIVAGQVTPFMGGFNIASDTSITVRRSGFEPSAPLSGGNSLSLSAPSITSEGVLRAPLGSIALDAGTTGSVQLLPGSVTTVSGEGRVYLYGSTIDGGATFNNPNGLPIQSLPEKRVTLKGGVTNVAKDALIDVQGGGDFLAKEFVSGPTGRVDILAQSGAFAIVPAYGNNMLGDVVDLSSFDGVAAGRYTLLPAEYALLPGAYLIEQADSTDAVRQQSRQIGDGSFIVSGKRATQFTTNKDESSSTWRLTRRNNVTERGEYLLTGANQYFSSEVFTTSLQRSGLPSDAKPRLAADGGSVELLATQSLSFNGTIAAKGLEGRSGGQVDITSTNIVIATADTDISDLPGYVRVDPTQLSGIAESVLIGGVRRRGAQGSEIVVGLEKRSADPLLNTEENYLGAKNVVVRTNATNPLSGSEILLAASESVQFSDGAVVRAIGDGANKGDVRIRPLQPKTPAPALGDPTDPVILPAEDRGALVRVSNLGDSKIIRTGAQADAGDIRIGAGVRLEASDAIALDATQNTVLAQGGVLSANAISLAASVINVGDTPTVTTGLSLDRTTLQSLSTNKSLRLKSNTDIRLYGDVKLSAVEQLSIETGGFVNAGAAPANLTLGSNVVEVGNLGNAIASSTGTGADMTINADTLILNSGTVLLDYINTTFNVNGRSIFKGESGVQARGALTVRTSDLTADAGAKGLLDASGALSLQQANTPLANLPAFSTAAATLQLMGQKVDINTKISLNSGQVQATARDGDLIVGSAGMVDVSGVNVDFYEVDQALPAGAVQLVSTSKNVNINAGSLINISGAAGNGGDAGSLTLKAANGAAVIDGTLRAQAALENAGASFTLVSQTAPDFSALASKLNDNGFSRARSFAVSTGDVVIDGTTRVDQFTLSTSTGSVRVASSASIISSSAKGGEVLIASGRDLTVDDGAKIDVAARSANGRGGRIDLEVGSTGTINVGAADFNVAAQGTGKQGQVNLRASRMANDVAVGQYKANVTGGNTLLEAYSVENLGSGNGIIDTALQTKLLGRSSTYMSNASAVIRNRLGQADTNRFRIQPGIEIRAGGNLTLANDWNLASARFNNVPGILTLRAGGDLILNGNLSDGFLSATPEDSGPSSDSAITTSRLTNDRSWSYNLVAGADLAQASVLAVRPAAENKGDVQVNGLVRTGTGDIKLAAARDITYKPAQLWSIKQGFDPETFSQFLSVTRPDGNVEQVLSSDGFSYEVSGLGLISVESSNVSIDATALGGTVRSYAVDIAVESLNALYDNSAAVYSVGEDAAPLDNFQTPGKIVKLRTESGSVTGFDESYYNSAFLRNGGDVSLRAGRKIAGSVNPNYTFDWYARRGSIITTPANALGEFDPGFNSLATPFEEVKAEFFDFATGANSILSTGSYRQTAGFIFADSFRQGVAALGGGDVNVSAGGDIVDLGVFTPITTRVGGGIPDSTDGTTILPKTLSVNGGGDLQVRSGGDIKNAWFWAGKGQATIVSNGVISNATLILDDAQASFTSGGNVSLGVVTSGNLNTSNKIPSGLWLGYTPDSTLSVQSLGGDVTLQTPLVAKTSNVLPSQVSLVAFNGNVKLQGSGDSLFSEYVVDSSENASFNLLAKKDIVFTDKAKLFIDLSDSSSIARALNPRPISEARINFGDGGAGYNGSGGDNVHENKDSIIRMYATDGSLYSTEAGVDNLINAEVTFGREARVRVGGDLRLSGALYQHDADDVSLFEAGGSMYRFKLDAFGEGRTWVQAGNEIYGFNANVAKFDSANPLFNNPDNGMSLSVLAGINQEPAYAKFFDSYINNPAKGEGAVYLSQRYADITSVNPVGQSTVLGDDLTRASIYAVDLVNYYRELFGKTELMSLKDANGNNVARGDLVSQISKDEYDAALGWFAELDPVKQRPLASRIVLSELQLAGREAAGSSSASDPQKLRNGDPSRGYTAIGTLFPGAQRKPGEIRIDGDSKWKGNLLDAGAGQDRIFTAGGGGIELLVPGGNARLASLSVADTSPEEAGLISQDGGSISALTYGDYAVNQSRTITANSGDILVWSSFGSIDSGKGRKSSLSIPPTTYSNDKYLVTRVNTPGLPNGAGIASLDKVNGGKGGDVDLYAFLGKINAGDAGIRVSRDLFIGAQEISGLDNIKVGGVANVELNPEAAKVGPINLANLASAGEAGALAKAFGITEEVEKLRSIKQTLLNGAVVDFGGECATKEECADEKSKKDSQKDIKPRK